MKPILEVAKSLGIDPAHVEPYGHWKGKLALAAFRDRPRPALIKAKPAAANGASKTKSPHIAVVVSLKSGPSEEARTSQ